MPRSKNPRREKPSLNRDRKFAAKFVETSSGVEAYRAIGLGTGNYFADHAGASRMLKRVKAEIEVVQRRLEQTAIATLREKQAMLSDMAYRNYSKANSDNADTYLALGAIRELNKMEGHYAPSKTQRVVGNFSFVQHIGENEKPAEKPVLGEVVEEGG